MKNGLYPRGKMAGVLTLILGLILSGCGAIETQSQYTVSFDTDGGNAIKLLKVNEGESLGSRLPAPVKQDFDFSGWFTQKNGQGTEYKADTPVTGDITLYAKWMPPSGSTYTVSFDTDGGSVIDPLNVTQGGALGSQLPVPAKPNHDFSGWFTEENGQGTEYKADTPVTGDITLYAKWWHIKYDKTNKTVYFLSSRGDWGNNWNTGEDLKLQDFYNGQLEKGTAYKITVCGNLDTELNIFGMMFEVLEPYPDYVDLSYWDPDNMLRSNILSGYIEVGFILNTNFDSAIEHFGQNAFVHLTANPDLVPDTVAAGTVMAKITNFSMTIEKLPGF